MQRYAGELTQDDGRPQAPMLFDGWGYVPLDAAAGTRAPARPEPGKQPAKPVEPVAR